jgi:hypothetical protein
MDVEKLTREAALRQKSNNPEDSTPYLKQIYLGKFSGNVTYISDVTVVFSTDQYSSIVLNKRTAKDDSELFWLSMIFAKNYVEAGDSLKEYEIDNLKCLAKTDDQIHELAKLLLSV